MYTIQTFISPFTAKYINIAKLWTNKSMQKIKKKTTIDKKGFTNFTRN